MSTALVTGASEGIGYEFCKVLASQGYDLIVVARRADALNRVATEIVQTYGVKCHVIAADLVVPSAADELFNRVVQQSLQVDFLVNNAGVLFNGPFLQTDRLRQESLLQLNMAALTSLTHLFATPMVQRKRGHILNVASIAAWAALPNENVYAASKAYVLAFTLALADELDACRSGVHVTALCPGFTATKMLTDPAQGPTLSIPSFMILSPQTVARQGIEGCLKGKPLVMPGLSNRILMYVGQLLPKMWVTRLMGAIYRRSMG